jgi:hypothetical protein
VWPTPKPTPAVDRGALSVSAGSSGPALAVAALPSSASRWLSFRVASGSVFDVA